MRTWRVHKVPLAIAATSCMLLFLYSFGDSDLLNVGLPFFTGVSKLKIVIVGADNMHGVKRRKNRLDGQGCNFPKLEQNGIEMMQFIETAEPLDCEKKSGEKNWVFIDGKGILTKIPERMQSDCTIRYFERKTDYENQDKPKKTMEIGKKMEGDFAEVNCEHNGDSWKGLLMSISRDESLIKNLKEKSGGKKSGIDRLDVVMFGFDSMSQQHFRRKMPATVRKLNMMGAVILNGYNIVGDGTPQAFIPILTSKTELELPNTRKRYKDAHHMDVYPFVWNNFSDAGYATLYGEDAYTVGVYTYRLKGFEKQPTDHYSRTFWKEFESWGTPQCIGSEPTHKSWFRYSQEFLREYKDVDRFLLMHQGALSHDDINLIEVEDQDFADSLASMEKEGLLDNAVLIVMADHGHRFMKIRDTHQGQLEERLPMFSVRLPPKFRETELGKKIQENLILNKNRLSTPFDIHATFLDILNLPKNVEQEQDKNKRSLSLFKPIPADRSCARAGVEPHWCTCLNWQNATITWQDQVETRRIAEGLASAIDSQIATVRHLCANVTLKAVISSQKLTPNDGLLKYRNVKDTDGFEPKFGSRGRANFAHYQLKIITSPNDAVFEATVFYDALKNSLEVDLTSLSHVNRYGDDPHCIISDKFSLAHFCVCHDRVRT